MTEKRDISDSLYPTNDVPARLTAFANQNGYVFNGPVYNIYLTDENSETDENRYLLKVLAAVREANLSLTQYALTRF